MTDYVQICSETLRLSDSFWRVDPFFKEGFESGNLAKWYYNSFCWIERNIVHHGGCSAKIRSGSSEGQLRLPFALDSEKVYIKFAFRFTASTSNWYAPLVGGEWMHWSTGSYFTFKALLLDRKAGTGATYLAYLYANNFYDFPYGPLSANTWYIVEIEWSSNPRTVALWVNGRFIARVDVQFGPSICDFLLFGGFGSGAVHSFDIWIDCISVSYTSLGSTFDPPEPPLFGKNLIESLKITGIISNPKFRYCLEALQIKDILRSPKFKTLIEILKLTEKIRSPFCRYNLESFRILDRLKAPYFRLFTENLKLTEPQTVTFGTTTLTDSNSFYSLKNRMWGPWHTCPKTGSPVSIFAFLKVNAGNQGKIRALIFDRTAGGTFVAASEERELSGPFYDWLEFKFAPNQRPQMQAGRDYVLILWANFDVSIVISTTTYSYRCYIRNRTYSSTVNPSYINQGEYYLSREVGVYCTIEGRISTEIEKPLLESFELKSILFFSWVFRKILIESLRFRASVAYPILTWVFLTSVRLFTKRVNLQLKERIQE